jgi:hypothetical protein
MRVLRTLNLVLVTALGIAAAVPKLLQMPPEVAFFQAAGLGSIAVVAFGLVQLAAGLLTALPATRKRGATLLAAAFLASAVMLMITGQVAFGLFSLLPVVMAVIVVLGAQGRASAPGSAPE